MQRIIYFLNRNKELILFLSLFFFCFYINISYNQYNKSKFINSSNSLFSFFFETKRNISKYFDLEYQNKILIHENSKLKKQLFNNDYEKIGSLNEKKFEITPASVIKNSYNKQYNFLTINVGSSKKIKIDNGVISSNGVIGIVDKVSEKYARVISILNKNFFLNAKHKKTNFFGIISWNGKDPQKVQLKDIPRRAEISIGDTIVTGGNSLIFPKGIFVGTVVSFKLDLSENYIEIEVLLSADLRNLDNVYILNNNNFDEIISLYE
tara:strand:- start:2214 stop:3008 length:795 start_codon:yes stop_codon:yes gene_type:complete